MATPGSVLKGFDRAQVLYDYVATCDDELTVKQGEIITIIDAKDLNGWSLVLNNKNHEGYIPTEYTIKIPPPRYHSPHESSDSLQLDLSIPIWDSQNYDSIPDLEEFEKQLLTDHNFEELTKKHKQSLIEHENKMQEIMDKANEIDLNFSKKLAQIQSNMEQFHLQIMNGWKNENEIYQIQKQTNTESSTIEPPKPPKPPNIQTNILSMNRIPMNITTTTLNNHYFNNLTPPLIISPTPSRGRSRSPPATITNKVPKENGTWNLEILLPKSKARMEINTMDTIARIKHKVELLRRKQANNYDKIDKK